MKVQEDSYYHQLPKPPSTPSRVSFSPKPQQEQAVTVERVQLDLETPSSEGASAPFFSRQRMKDVMRSTYYQVAVVILVVAEACVVVAELMIEAQTGDLHLVGKSQEGNHHLVVGVQDVNHRHVVEALHITALALLSIFLLELVVKLAVLRREMLRSWVELVDGAVVVVATGLEAASFHHRGAMQAGGLLVTLRLWRIFRVQNSLVAAAHMAGERKLESEQRARRQLETELGEKQNTIDKLAARCSVLELSLVQQGLVPPQAVGEATAEQ